MKKDDGGAAFPRVGEQSTPHTFPDKVAQSGMSLRDYFAAAALQARIGLKDNRTRNEIVEDSWADADAMLVKRS